MGVFLCHDSLREHHSKFCAVKGKVHVRDEVCFESFLSGKCTGSSVASFESTQTLLCYIDINNNINNNTLRAIYLKQLFIWKRNSKMLLLLLSCEMFGLFLQELGWNKYPVPINVPFSSTGHEGKSSYPIKDVFIYLFIYLKSEAYSLIGASRGPDKWRRTSTAHIKECLNKIF